MAEPCSLEALAAELQIMLLHSLVGQESLTALVHASPSFYRLYNDLTDKEDEEIKTKSMGLATLKREMLTRLQVLINQLMDRGLPFVSPGPILEILTLNFWHDVRTAPFDFKPVRPPAHKTALSVLLGFSILFIVYALTLIQTCYKLFDMFERNEPIVLSAEDRRILSDIGLVVKWDIVKVGNGIRLKRGNGPLGKPYPHYPGGDQYCSLNSASGLLVLGKYRVYEYELCGLWICEAQYIRFRSWSGKDTIFAFEEMEAESVETGEELLKLMMFGGVDVTELE